MKNEIEKILEAFEKEIQNIDASPEIYETGIVRSVADGIATVSGLLSCKMSEVLIFENGVRGLALNLNEDSIGVILLGNGESVKQGQSVKRSGEVFSLSVGETFLGRVVNPLMETIDGGSNISVKNKYPVEKIAPGVMSREPVSVPLQTGIKVIDALVPIGRGQRELIIGDRQTGKTTLAIDSIINQKGQGVVCIYVAIGQKKANVVRTVETLKENGAMDYTTVILADASDSPALLYLAPYVGATLGEYFMDKKKDVLIVYDDLSKHAAAYREISLLLRRPPGREAYPGDVFYIHSRLLERACRRNDKHGGGSMTALPIVETQAGDVSGYIPTNVISITDGQIFLESNLFNKGIRPAINPGLSVSRVGGAAQIKSMKKNAGTLKISLAQYKELESFAQFGSDLDVATKNTIERGRRISEIMKQKQYSPVQTSKQVLSAFAVNNGYLDEIKIESIRKWESEFHLFLENSHKKLLDKIENDWDEKIEKETNEVLEKFFKTWSE